MENLTLFRISAITTFSMLVVALITPIATVAVDLTQSSDGLAVLEFVCVWCQYGSTSNNPYGTAIILNFTSFDFYYMWIPILMLLGMAIIPVLKSFPDLEISKKFSDSFAVNILWVISVLSILLRGLLSIFIRHIEDIYQSQFPDNFVKGELGWGAASLIFATISAASTAMFGFIEFLYEP